MIRSTWNAERDAILSARWEAGDSAGAIARELGCSKNAVIGRANRMALAARQSPVAPAVISDHDKAQMRWMAELGMSRTAIARRYGCRLETVSKHVGSDGRFRQDTLHSRAYIQRPAYWRPIGPIAPAASCQYPLWGDDERATHLYCDAPTKDGSSYCAEHHAACWHPVEVDALVALPRKVRSDLGLLARNVDRWAA